MVRRGQRTILQSICDNLPAVGTALCHGLHYLVGVGGGGQFRVSDTPWVC